MNRGMLKSTLVSMGVHLLLLMPAVPLGGAAIGPMTDVIPGVSSVDFELIYVPGRPALTAEEGEELPKNSAKSAVQEREIWENDGGAVQNSRAQSFLQNLAPQYPWKARINGWQGQVLIRASITPGGRAESAQVAESSGFSVLDGAALGAVRDWQFVPARRGGQQVASNVEIPIVFKLDQEKK